MCYHLPGILLLNGFTHSHYHTYIAFHTHIFHALNSFTHCSHYGVFNPPLTSDSGSIKNRYVRQKNLLGSKLLGASRQVQLFHLYYYLIRLHEGILVR